MDEKLYRAINSIERRFGVKVVQFFDLEHMDHFAGRDLTSEEWEHLKRDSHFWGALADLSSGDTRTLLWDWLAEREKQKA